MTWEKGIGHKQSTSSYVRKHSVMCGCFLLQKRSTKHRHKTGIQQLYLAQCTSYYSLSGIWKPETPASVPSNLWWKIKSKLTFLLSGKRFWAGNIWLAWRLDTHHCPVRELSISYGSILDIAFKSILGTLAKQNACCW